MEVFTITREESERIEKEYLINDCLYYLIKSKEFVDGSKTINEAIEELGSQTRFKDEILSLYKKNMCYTASDYLEIHGKND